jgi:3',5'-cyclic AMP phosphodiesterase CpdA
MGLVADAQYADAEARGTRFYRQSLAKLTEAIESLNARNLDCCVNVGDLIDKDWGSFDKILEPLARSRHRVHHLLGNHDFEVGQELKLRVPKKLGLKRRYYAIQAPGFCLVMLDTTDVSTYAHPEASTDFAEANREWKRVAATGAINAQTWNGAVGESQLKWFEDTCRKAGKARRRVVVFSHHPVFPANAHNEWNSDALLRVVERNRNIVGWINGHNHAGGFGIHDGVPFVTLKGMVETKEANSFAVLELLPDRMTLEGFGREESREVQFRTS